MMEEEEFQCTCPRCGTVIGFDEVGDSVVLEEAPLPEGTFFNGNRSITVEDADGGEYRRLEYLRNQGGRPLFGALKPPTAFQKLAETLEPEPEPEPEPIDPALLSASAKDLKDRGL